MAIVEADGCQHQVGTDSRGLQIHCDRPVALRATFSYCEEHSAGLLVPTKLIPRTAPPTSKTMFSTWAALQDRAARNNVKQQEDIDGR